MKNTMIKLVDAIILIAVVIVIAVATIAGFAAGPLQGLLMGLLAFIGASFACALWFCISGTYHNTKLIADSLANKG